eukprot:2104802-Pyramimonas_sp.AAC.1
MQVNDSLTTDYIVAATRARYRHSPSSARSRSARISASTSRMRARKARRASLSLAWNLAARTLDSASAAPSFSSPSACTPPRARNVLAQLSRIARASAKGSASAAPAQRTCVSWLC